MIKLIASDLDGSLLSDDKQLPADFWEIANQLKQSEITFAIASGRPSSNISSIFDAIRDWAYFICDNGSYVIQSTDEIFVSPIDFNSIRKFVELSRSVNNAYPVLCGKHIAYIEDDNENFKDQVLQYYQEFKIVDDLTFVNDTIVKISLCDLTGAEKNSYPYFKKFKNSFKIVVAGEIWLDITNTVGSKGNAIQLIQQRLNISAEETLVFGDYMNDLDMIQNAAYSYAMKNAHPQILKAAKYITEFDNNNGGVTHTIRQLLNIP